MDTVLVNAGTRVRGGSAVVIRTGNVCDKRESPRVHVHARRTARVLQLGFDVLTIQVRGEP